MTTTGNTRRQTRPAVKTFVCNSSAVSRYEGMFILADIGDSSYR